MSKNSYCCLLPLAYCLVDYYKSNHRADIEQRDPRQNDTNASVSVLNVLLIHPPPQLQPYPIKRHHDQKHW